MAGGDVRVSTDAAALNAIVNHPDVYPWVCGDIDGPLDLSSVVADERNILLTAKHGAFLLHWHEPGTYEVHTQFLPEGRGPRILVACRAGWRYLFTQTDAVEVFTKVPVGNTAAERLAVAAGFRHLFLGGRWRVNGQDVPVNHYRYCIEDWIASTTTLEQSGRWFHDELARQGAEADHDDDPIHDRYVGACVEMIRGGQAGKAVTYYNRWARFYGYEPIAILSDDPLVIDIGTAVLKINGMEVEVLSCQ